MFAQAEDYGITHLVKIRNMAITIKERKIEKIVEKTVFRILQRALTDPDFGLEVHPEFEKKLKKSTCSKKSGRLKNFDDVILSLP